MAAPLSTQCGKAAGPSEIPTAHVMNRDASDDQSLTRNFRRNRSNRFAVAHARAASAPEQMAHNLAR